jgi:hypothetical protein
MSPATKAKRHWRDRLAELPRDRQEKVIAAVKETLKRLRDTPRRDLDGQSLH